MCYLPVPEHVDRHQCLCPLFHVAHNLFLAPDRIREPNMVRPKVKEMNGRQNKTRARHNIHRVAFHSGVRSTRKQRASSCLP